MLHASLQPETQDWATPLTLPGMYYPYKKDPETDINKTSIQHFFLRLNWYHHRHKT